MKLRSLGLTLLLTTVGAGIAAVPARADHYARYYEYRYYHGRDRDEIRRRDILHDRLIDIADRVRLAEREGDIGHRQARHVYDKLDDVRDLLHHDRYITEDEFHRWRDRLEDADHDFRSNLRRDRHYDRDHDYDRGR
jgi:hypothetical protein